LNLVSLPVGPAAAPIQLSGVVLRARSGFYTVQADDGRLIECRLRGRLKEDRSSSALVVIGDRVTVELQEDGGGMIEAVAERTSRFSRRQPGPNGAWKEDLLVANVDQVLVVFACADPMPHLRMLDRFLVVAEHNEVEAVVVANKVDLVGMAEAERLFATYRHIGYPVHLISAREGIGVEELADRLDGRLSVVTGPSGVGKSTLLNAIQPGLRIDTGAVSGTIHKGRHTTTMAELHPLTGPGGGYVADTPGLRELGLWRIPDSELAWCFPEMRAYLGGCAFNDCRHVAEPRCAVLAAVAAGTVSAARHESYRRLLLNED
jgi:ribosome biogenesis GTPase